MKLLTSAQVAQIKQALNDPTADRCFSAIGMLDKAPSFKADKWIDALIERAKACAGKEENEHRTV
jgi:hypothetical protein